EMCISGKPVRAPEALKLGLIDRVIEGDLLAGAISFARELKGPHRKTSDRSEKLGTPSENAPIYAAGRRGAPRRRSVRILMWAAGGGPKTPAATRPHRSR